MFFVSMIFMCNVMLYISMLGCYWLAFEDPCIFLKPNDNLNWLILCGMWPFVNNVAAVIIYTCIVYRKQNDLEFNKCPFIKAVLHCMFLFDYHLKKIKTVNGNSIKIVLENSGIHFTTFDVNTWWKSICSFNTYIPTGINYVHWFLCTILWVMYKVWFLSSPTH